jgi:hypothetical protein
VGTIFLDKHVPSSSGLCFVHVCLYLSISSVSFFAMFVFDGDICDWTFRFSLCDLNSVLL